MGHQISSISSVVSDALAIDGGPTIRNQPLPCEWPGTTVIDEQEVEAVAAVVRARSPFRYYGPDLLGQVGALECKFTGYTGQSWALAVNSGTAALSCAMAAMGVGPGKEVLVPAYMWVSTIAAVVRLGAIPVLVDIDDTFTMDPADLQRKITPRSHLITVVHMSGGVGDMKAISAIAQRHDLWLLEDCAQAAGATLDGAPAGSFGDGAIYSFQLNKNMTSGDGGMIVCRDEQIYRRAFACHDLGYARTSEGRLDTSDIRCQLWGQGSRMSELTAAMALVQFGKLATIVGRMRAAKRKILDGIGNIDGITFRRFHDAPGEAGVFMITTYQTPQVCQQFTQALRAEGIVPGPGGCYNVPMTEWGLHIYYNIPSLVHKTSISDDGWPWTHPANSASSHEYGKGTCPQCDDLIARSNIFSIPPDLNDQDITDIIVGFRKVAAHLL